MNVNSFEYLKLLLDTCREGVVACDNNFKITYLNKRISEIHGASLEAPDSWPEQTDVYEMDGVTLTPRERLPLYRALKGEKVSGAYHVLKFKNLKTSVLVKYHAEPLFDDKGTQIGAFLTAQDKEDLAYSMARLKAIFEQSPLSIQILDKTGKTLLVNESYKKLWGLSEEQVREFVLKKYNILEDPILIESGEILNVRKAFAGETVQLEPFLYDPGKLGIEGRARWASGVIYPLKDHHNQVHEVVIIHQDISEQKIIDSERKNLLAQLEAILRQMPAGVMVADDQGRISLYNEQMKSLIGDPSSAFHTFKDFLVTAMKGEVVTNHELEVTQNNHTKFLSTRSGPIYDPQGRINASVLLATEITKEKRTEANDHFLAKVKSLLMSTIEFDQVLNQIGDIVIPYMSDACQIDVVEGDQLKRVVCKHRDPDIHELLNYLKVHYPLKFGTSVPSMRAIETGKPELIQAVDEELLRRRTYNEDHFKLVKKVGSRSHMVFPLQGRGHILGAINFIITRKDRPLFDEVDFELGKNIARYASLVLDNASLYRDAKSAIRLRDDFISIASHELRTPITSMNLQIEVLKSLVDGIQNQDQTTEMMGKFLASTKNQLQRLTRLVDDMLDIARIDSGKLKLNFREVNLRKIVHDVLARFDEQTKSLRIEVKLFCEEDIHHHCDGERLDQVLTNFMTNSIRYGNKSPIHIYLHQTEDKIILKVQDFGRGICKEDQERIFNRFERSHTPQDVSGLGLGLYINKQIVEEHKGKILLESEPNKGATFIVELPRRY